MEIPIFLIESPDMAHLDRLSTLIAQFQVGCDRLTSPARSNLALHKTETGEETVTLYLRDCPDTRGQEDAFLNIRVDVGGAANPLFQSLPCRMTADLNRSPEIRSIVQLIKAESAAPRCGGSIVLDRLCELLVVNLLRQQIEHQGAAPGVFLGLGHPRLSRVLVALHDNPGRHWVVDDLVTIAGMSRSNFMAEFQAVVGSSPMAYLKQWRMILARGALLNGARVNETARKFGYGSGDAFSRAFAATYGVPPTQISFRGPHTETA